MFENPSKSLILFIISHILNKMRLFEGFSNIVKPEVE